MISDNFKHWWDAEGEARVIGFITSQSPDGPPSMETLKSLAAYCYDSALHAVFHGQIGPRDIGKYLNTKRPSLVEDKPFEPPTSGLPIGDR